MKNCPLCNIPLNPIDYEDMRVFQCFKCRGHLMSLARLDGIKRANRKKTEALKAEASDDLTRDTDVRIACPRCHAWMTKEALDLPALDLHADVCKPCQLVWLDGGELALIQLAYETSAKFLNNQQIKQRMRDINASPERKAAFEANLNRLPDSEDAVENTLGTADKSILRAYLNRPHQPGFPWND